MSPKFQRWAQWLQRRCENVAVLFMTVMFLSFLYQVFGRYFMSRTAAWTEEICVISWVWAVLWGTAFVTRREDDIRFDLLHAIVPEGVRRVFDGLAGLAMVALFLVGLPGAWSYVTFMKIETTAALSWRFHLVFSVYIVFVLAVLARQVLAVWDAIAPNTPPPSTHPA